MKQLFGPMTPNPHGLKEANHTVSAIILDSENRVLLMMDDRAPMWTLIGGNLDPHEDHLSESGYISALHREISEEIQTSVELLDFVGETWAPYPPVDKPPYKDGYNHERIYLCTIADNQPSPTLGEDGACIQWFPMDNLPPNLVPRVRMRIDAWRDRGRTKPFSIVMEPETLGRKGFAPELYKMNREQISGWKEWIGHPRVQQKLVDERCFLPFNDAIAEVTEWATPTLASSAARLLQRRA